MPETEPTVPDRAAEPAAPNRDVGEDESALPSYAPKFFKGCGCVTACIILGVAVALAGNGDVESWGSGIAGVVILIFVVTTSGLTGWHKK